MDFRILNEEDFCLLFMSSHFNIKHSTPLQLIVLSLVNCKLNSIFNMDQTLIEIAHLISVRRLVLDNKNLESNLPLLITCPYKKKNISFLCTQI